MSFDAELCQCGHPKYCHLPHILDKHGGECSVEGCECENYTWARFVVYMDYVPAKTPSDLGWSPDSGWGNECLACPKCGRKTIWSKRNELNGFSQFRCSCLFCDQDYQMPFLSPRV